MSEEREFKVKEVLRDSGQSAWKKYRAICHGKASLWQVLKCELILTLFSGIPGAAGLVLRSKTFPSIFQKSGKKVVFGKHITVRHPKKIQIGNNVIIDDNCVLDAKGESNHGITIEDNVYIGRNTIIYCKDGDILIRRNVNISSNCQIFSSNRLEIREDTLIGAYSYLLSGGEYEYGSASGKFSEQSGTASKGELIIGSNCWLAARVTVLDAASIGDHCVIGAGAVVTRPIPPDSIAVGIPAKVLKSIS